MFLELLLNPIFLLLEGLLSFLPDSFNMPGWISDAVSLINKALIFFPSDVWGVVVGSVVFWIGFQMTWAIIEWLYKKIPGVD